MKPGDLVRILYPRQLAVGYGNFDSVFAMIVAAREHSYFSVLESGRVIILHKDWLEPT